MFMVSVMKTYWKCLIAAFLVLTMAASVAFIPGASAAPVGGLWPMDVRGAPYNSWGTGHASTAAPRPSQSNPGHTGGGHGGASPVAPSPSQGHHGRTGSGPGGASPTTGHRTFDRSTFFKGHDHTWWVHNQKHYYWNGNSWVYGIEPIGFVEVPVPIASCPYTPGMYNGDANACFFSCSDAGYDPISVCDVCCGTNY
jgi:hypothetical protein